MTSEVGETNSINKAIDTKNTLEQQGECANSSGMNMCQPQDFETSSIPYSVSQSKLLE